MTGAKHTAGPWVRGYHDEVRIDYASGGTHFTLLADGRDCPVALVPDTSTNGWGPASDELEANARLIAAAPDLLEELTALLAATAGDLTEDQLSETGADATYIATVRFARAAIAKATGAGQ